MRPPIEVAHLFSLLDDKLIDMLRGLTAAEWQLPTLAKKWTVKDVAAHLLDGNIRAISSRDNHPLPPARQMKSYDELVQHLDALNATWVAAMQRVSPATLIDLLEKTGRQYSAIMELAPLFIPAPFSVAWAGETTSENWFHIAREYTEKMHHQLQVRQAIDSEAALLTSVYFYPFIQTLMYGLPHALRNTEASDGTCVEVAITGEAGGKWFAEKYIGQWRLKDAGANHVNAKICLPPTVAWKLFTKGISPAEAIPQVDLIGDEQLCVAVLNMVTVMA